MRKILLVLFAVSVVPLLLASTAYAQAGPLITFDENGNGNFAGVPLNFALGPDPGPGGLPQVLNYFALPFAGTPGDVRMHDAFEPGNPFLDVIRFNGDGRIFFYSDNVGGADALADTPSPPTAFYPNLVDIQEQGPEGGFQDAFYSPQPGQPGFDPSFPTYHIVSDGVVPEPTSLALVASGMLAIASFSGALRRRKSAA